MQILENTSIKLNTILESIMSLTYKLETAENKVAIANAQPFSKILMLNASLTLAELDTKLNELREFIEAIGNEMLSVNDQYIKCIQVEPKMEYSFRMVLMSGAIEWLRSNGFAVDEEVLEESDGQQQVQQQVMGIADILVPIHAALLKTGVNLDEFNAHLAELSPQISEIYVDVIAASNM